MLLKHYLRRTLKNNLSNFWLQFLSRIRFLLEKDPTRIRRVEPPKGYELAFEDDFRGTDLNSEEWRYGHPWGFFHPDQLWWYWSKDATEFSGDSIVLKNRYLPKEIYKKDLPHWQQLPDLPEEFTLPWASGLISSKRSFKFGWIEAEIKLPLEKMQWSAFWLGGKDTWPPEIDIFEAYTEDNEEDISLRPNIHWGIAGTWRDGKKDYGAPRIFIKSPEKRFVQYAIHWTDKFINFYFDGQLVQVTNNKEMLDDNSQEQYIIINNGLQEPKDGKIATEGMMEVRNLRVYQEMKAH